MRIDHFTENVSVETVDLLITNAKRECWCKEQVVI